MSSSSVAIPVFLFCLVSSLFFLSFSVLLLIVLFIPSWYCSSYSCFLFCSCSLFLVVLFCSSYILVLLLHLLVLNPESWMAILVDNAMVAPPIQWPDVYHVLAVLLAVVPPYMDWHWQVGPFQAWPVWAHKEDWYIILAYNEGGCVVANRWMDASNGEWFQDIPIHGQYKGLHLYTQSSDSECHL